MNLNCPICQELFIPSSDVIIIPCGHLFHANCMNIWIDSYNSKTCPQCRNKVKKKDVIKVYFNFAETAAPVEDAATLQFKLDNASFQLRLKEKEIEKLRNKIVHVNESNKGLRDMVKDFETKQLRQETLTAALKQQIRDMSRQTDKIEKLQAENEKLLSEINLLDNVRKIITDSQTDVNEMLKSHRDTETRDLILMIATLKKELIQQKNKKEKFRKQLLTSQILVRKYEHKLDEENSKIIIINSKIEEFEREKSMLKQQIAELKEQINKQKLLNTKTADENSEENINVTFQTSNLNCSKLNRRIVTNNIENDVLTEIKAIKDSESPYLRLKSSSVGSKITRATDNLNPNCILFKKRRLTTTSALNNARFLPLSDDALAGLGGHPKIDEFPARRLTCVNKKYKTSNKVRRFVKPSSAPINNSTLDNFIDLSKSISSPIVISDSPKLFDKDCGR